MEKPAAVDARTTVAGVVVAVGNGGKAEGHVLANLNVAIKLSVVMKTMTMGVVMMMMMKMMVMMMMMMKMMVMMMIIEEPMVMDLVMTAPVMMPMTTTTTASMTLFLWNTCFQIR